MAVCLVLFVDGSIDWLILGFDLMFFFTWFDTGAPDPTIRCSFEDPVRQAGIDSPFILTESAILKALNPFVALAERPVNALCRVDLQDRPEVYLMQRNTETSREQLIRLPTTYEQGTCPSNTLLSISGSLSAPIINATLSNRLA